MSIDTHSPSNATSVRPGYVAGTLVLVVLNGLASFTRRGGGASRVSYLVGALLSAAATLLVTVVLVHLAARLLGKVKTPAAKSRTVFWAMAALLLFNLGDLVSQSRPKTPITADTVVTDSERAALKLGSDSIWHGTFGFVLPVRGFRFVANPSLQRTLDEGLSQQPGMAAWALRDTLSNQTLLLEVTKLAQLDEAGFRRYTTGIRQGFTRSKVVSETLTWPNAPGEYHLTMLHPNGQYIMLRCLPRVTPGRALVLCVQTATRDQSDLDPLRRGLRLLP